MNVVLGQDFSFIYFAILKLSIQLVPRTELRCDKYRIHLRSSLYSVL